MQGQVGRVRASVKIVAEAAGAMSTGVKMRVCRGQGLCDMGPRCVETAIFSVESWIFQEIQVFGQRGRLGGRKDMDKTLCPALPLESPRRGGRGFL